MSGGFFFLKLRTPASPVLRGIEIPRKNMGSSRWLLEIQGTVLKLGSGETENMKSLSSLCLYALVGQDRFYPANAKK